MPFQVSFSTKTTPQGIITSFTAGEDQVVVCDTAVNLEATVVGDLTGHTIIWEQISGVAVTFTTPLDQFAISYTTANFQDKTFRFTIDKGTGNEQFDDVIMFSTPTYPYFGGAPDQNCLINFGATLRGDAPFLEIRVKIPTIFSDTIAHECGTNTKPELFWSEPDNAEFLVQYVVQQRSVAGPFTDEAIIPASSARTHVPLVVGATYRVVAVFLEGNSSFNSVPSNTIFQDGLFGDTVSTNGSGIVLDQAIQFFASRNKLNSQKILTYNINLITLLNCAPDAPDDFTLGQTIKPKHISITFNFNPLTLETCPPDAPDDFTLGQSELISHIRIPTYTVLDLHGGDIGG